MRALDNNPPKDTCRCPLGVKTLNVGDVRLRVRSTHLGLKLKLPKATRRFLVSDGPPDVEVFAARGPLGWPSDGLPLFRARGDSAYTADEMVPRGEIRGKVIIVERNGRTIDLGSSFARRRAPWNLISSVGNRIGAAIVNGFRLSGAGLVLLGLLVAFPTTATGSVGVVNKINFLGNNGATTSGAFNTIGANLVLVGVSLQKTNSVTSITYNTPTVQNFTHVSLCANGVNNTAAMEIWSLGPTFTPSSTATITITTNGVAASSVEVGAVAFSGASSLGVCVTATANSSSPSVTILPPAAGGVVFDTLAARTGSATPGGSQVAEWNFVNSFILGAGSVSAPTATMSWSLTASQTWALGAIPISASTTAVKASSLRVTRHAGGNLIELNTAREVSSLGFNLYREQDGTRVRLNSSLLAGTALLAGPQTTFTAGQGHVWLDRRPESNEQSAYWVEEVDLDGTTTTLGPAFAELPTESGIAALSPLVSDFNNTDVKPQLLNDLGRASGSTLPGSLAPECQPVNSGSKLFQRTGTQLVTTPDLQQRQYALAARPAIKVSVCAEGWYRISQPQLVAAGLNPDVDPRLLQLYANGVEQPMLVRGRQRDKLSPQGAVEFYAYPLDTTWSRMQVYWLVEGSGEGKRVTTEGLHTHAKAEAENFPATMVWTPRTLYFAALLNGDSDNFFGPVISSTPVTNSFVVTHLARSAVAKARLNVLLQGVSSGNHIVAVELNSHRLGTVRFNNEEPGAGTWAVPLTLLQQGPNNVLSVTSLGGQQDISVVNSVGLTYPRSYTADADYLRLTIRAGEQATIGGFSNSKIQVIDITKPEEVMVVPGRVTTQAAGYAVTVVPRGSGDRTLLAFAISQSRLPAKLSPNHPSHWHATQPGADVVIISHADFLSSLGPLQTLREQQGHTVATIDVQDLFDEFNFGVKSPYALKRFLHTASARWAQKPSFVLIVGDATFDPRNYLGIGQDDFVPTYLIDTQYLETASDDWFADFDLDGLTGIAIGRLPVRTATDASMLVSRIVRYETSSSGAWTHQVLLVAGSDDPGDPFTSYTAAVQALLPSTDAVSLISQDADSNAHDDLVSALKAGQLLVNFTGHGSNQLWAGGLLHSSDVAVMTNGSQTPFFISMTCLNGYFQDVYTVSLAKAVMLAPAGGAVGAWASSGLTDSSSQSILDQAMVAALFGSHSFTIGEAASYAKRSVRDPDVRRTWILFGDPATRLIRGD